MFRVARAAFAFTILIAAGAGADPAPETVRPPAGLTDMQAARMLIPAGRLEHARVFLQQALPSDEEQSIERLFLLGRLEMQLGMPESAAERFEAILSQRPGLTRVRLELAQAYYLAGRDDKARYHFNASLADELPTSVEAAVETFLRGIDARKRWSVSLSASMLPETTRPDREEVLIGGVPFRLSEDARASSGAGVLLSTGASRLAHLLDSRTSIRVEPTFEIVEAKTDHHGSRSIGLGATIARTFDGGLSVSLSPGIHVRRYASEDPLFGTRQIDRNYQLGVRVRHRSLRYGGFAPWLGYSFESNRSNIPIHDYRNHGVTAGVSRTF